MPRQLFLVFLLLGACAPAPPPATPSGVKGWDGRVVGSGFLPDFQRWQIVDAEPIDGVAIPPERASIPVSLYGRFVYLAPRYYTLPNLDGAGDRLVPACFSASPRRLTGRMPAPADAGGDLQLTHLPEGRAQLELAQQFLLTLEKRPLQDDGGYQQRRFDIAYNRHLTNLPPAVEGQCALAPLGIPLRPPRDLRVQALENGRVIVMPQADLDPETPLAPNGASLPQRRSLPLGDPSGIVAGCAGVVRVLRALAQPSETDPARNEFLVVGGVAGKTADGELCDRLTLVRRIDPERLLSLYNLPPQPSATRTTMRLLGWVGPNSFTAQVGDAEFELSQVDQPRLVASLVKAPSVTSSADVALEPELGAPPDVVAPAPAPRSRQPAPRRIERWVDENGVVHYSNTGRPPARP